MAKAKVSVVESLPVAGIRKPGTTAITLNAAAYKRYDFTHSHRLMQALLMRSLFLL
jgi:hypothetical protein